MSRTRPDHLAMLTRFPVPGETKRRLAEALGPGGAAMLHREVARYCYRRLEPMRATGEVTFEVLHSGGDQAAVRSWLGGAAALHRQVEGSLATKIRQAFERGFARGASRVVVVGSDCPECGGTHVRAALAQLDSRDVVLGPAQDGGYYLIALRTGAATRAMHALLPPGMPWGGTDVLARTLGAAADASLSTGLLDTLDDIDRPEDLAVWQEVRARAIRASERPRISVIIPAWNEAARVASAVASAVDGGAFEVIVVDCGSDDDTAHRAAEAGASVLTSERGRARQMNAGAKAAGGDVLLFLHADCTLPQDFAESVRECLALPSSVAGAFGFAVAEQRTGRRRLIHVVGGLRAALAIPYGDQGLFVPAQLFEDLGGFPRQPTMEDYELALRLKRLGRIARSPLAVQSSTREFDEHGVVRATATNLATITGYRLGVSPGKLAAWRARLSDRTAAL